MTASTVIRCLCQLFSIFGLPSSIHTDRGPSFMSKELQEFLTNKGISCSRTTSYNPQGNGQVERYNGIIWKAITMTLQSRDLPIQHWQSVLPDALHSVRSLLSTSTNATPHERLLNYPRRITTGTSVPTWLSTPGPVLLKRHIRPNKTDPYVDEVELLQANPHYAHIRYPDGGTTTVSTRHLAPVENPTGAELHSQPGIIPSHLEKPPTNVHPQDDHQSSHESASQGSPEAEITRTCDETSEVTLPRRSGRISRPPTRLTYS